MTLSVSKWILKEKMIIITIAISVSKEKLLFES